MEHPKVGGTINRPSAEVFARRAYLSVSPSGCARCPSGFLQAVGCLGRRGPRMARRLRCGPTPLLRPSRGYRAPSLAGSLDVRLPAPTFAEPTVCRSILTDIGSPRRCFQVGSPEV